MDNSYFNAIRFGQRLRRARLDKHITQADLARKLYTHFTLISHYEGGRAVPSLDRIYRIADILKVPVASLICDIDENKKD